MRETTRKKFVIFSFSAAIILATGCNEEETKSNWALSPPTIDGRMEEWQQASLAIFDNVHIAVGVGNDSTYLYLAARVADDWLRQAIQSSGFTLWLSPEGGSSKELEIRFPASRSAQTGTLRGGFWRSMTEDQRGRARSRLDEQQNGLLVIDQRFVDSRDFRPNSPDGFGAAIGETNGLASFEARIPFSLQLYFEGRAPLNRGGKIGIGIELTPSPMPGREFTDTRMPGEGSRGSVGGRGRVPGSFSPRARSSSQSSEIWLEVTLATP